MVKRVKLNRAIDHWLNRSLSDATNTWSRAAEERRVRREKKETAVRKWSLDALSTAVKTWRHTVEGQMRRDELELVLSQRIRDRRLSEAVEIWKTVARLCSWMNTSTSVASSWRRRQLLLSRFSSWSAFAEQSVKRRMQKELADNHCFQVLGLNYLFRWRTKATKGRDLRERETALVDVVSRSRMGSAVSQWKEASRKRRLYRTAAAMMRQTSLLPFFVRWWFHCSKEAIERKMSSGRSAEAREALKAARQKARGWSRSLRTSAAEELTAKIEVGYLMDRKKEKGENYCL